MEPEYRYLEPEEDDDPIAPARGIANGLVIGLGLWFVIFLTALFLIPRISP